MIITCQGLKLHHVKNTDDNDGDDDHDHDHEDDEDDDLNTIFN